MTKRLTLVAVVLWSAVAAAADAPTGFADIPWGTPSFKVSDAMSGRCVFTRMSSELAICTDYEIPTLGDVKVTFMSTPLPTGGPADGGLDGYRISAGWRSYKALRQLAYEKFGRDSERGGVAGREVIIWRWPRTGALEVQAALVESCGDTTSCLKVTTASRAAVDEERFKQAQEKARKSF